MSGFVDITGLERVQKQITALSGGQLDAALVKALNDGGHEARRRMQAQMRSTFDRVTPWIERSPKVIPATPQNLNVAILPTYRSDAGSIGGKQGVDPQHVLQAQALGGRRADKRSEVALKRAGILPGGYQTAIPTTPYQGSFDAYGNLRGPFLAQLISYFRAFNEGGYRANMGDRRRKTIHTQGLRGKGFVGPTRGVRFIVSYGGLRGGLRVTAKGDFDSRVSNLPPGIWAVQGTGGVDIRPVLMFVRQANYTPRLQLQEVAQDAQLQDYLSRRMRFRIREAFEKGGQ